MKLKSLLFMVTLLLTCLGVRADKDVVFEQHFESEQTAASTDVGFYEYINSKTGDTREVVDGALKIVNDQATLCKTERWQRAVKFRNLPLVEGNTYRLSFKMKGSKTYNDGETDVNCKLSSLLMQGEDNADISLFDFDGKEQRLEAENFNPDEFIEDSEQIQELRRWLWETHDNSLCDSDTGSNRHYHIFKPELDNIIKTYCERYGFDINID